MKIAILGTRGRLGGCLLRSWQSESHFELIPISRNELDLSHSAEVHRFASEIHADLVLNTAGLTSLEACEDHPDLATVINTEAPALLATTLAARSIPLLHFSTDYVFDGLQGTPYRETDTARPISQYGTSKLNGENAVLAASPLHWVLRVSWLYEGFRPAFPDQILSQARTQDRVEAIEDKFSVPTSCHDLANWLSILIKKRPAGGGRYHLCPTGFCSWQEYAQTVLDTQISQKLRCRTVSPIRLDAIPFFRAPRPRFSAMDSSAFFQILGQPAPTWQSALTKAFSNFTNF